MGSRASRRAKEESQQARTSANVEKELRDRIDNDAGCPLPPSSNEGSSSVRLCSALCETQGTHSERNDEQLPFKRFFDGYNEESVTEYDKRKTKEGERGRQAKRGGVEMRVGLRIDNVKREGTEKRQSETQATIDCAWSVECWCGWCWI